MNGGGSTMKSTMSLLLFFVVLMIYIDFRSCLSLFRFGDSPRQFNQGDPLMLKVHKLTSADVQLPYAYYSVPFCRPNATFDSAGYFGEFLGHGLTDFPYVLKMQQPQMCRVVCRITLDELSTKSFQEKIHQYYHVNMVLDGLPVAVHYQEYQLPTQEAADYYQIGFHIGLKGHFAGGEDIKYFIYNHLVFTVKYHKDVLTDLAEIVGFEVKPSSVNHEYDGKWNEKTTLTTCKTHGEETYISSGPQIVQENKEVVFTYDVIFQVY